LWNWNILNDLEASLFKEKRANPRVIEVAPFGDVLCNAVIPSWLIGLKYQKYCKTQNT
jgi:hypothetical protein